MTANHPLKLTRKPVSLDDRLLKAQQNFRKKNNCVGTAFYLAGLHFVEKGTSTSEGMLLMKNTCYAIDKPAHDSFIAIIDYLYEQPVMWHIGYIFERESTLILAHRDGNKPFEQLPLEDYMNSKAFKSKYGESIEGEGAGIEYFKLPEVNNA